MTEDDDKDKDLSVSITVAPCYLTKRKKAGNTIFVQSMLHALTKQTKVHKHAKKFFGEVDSRLVKTLLNEVFHVFLLAVSLKKV